MVEDKPNIPDNSLIFINSGVGNPNNGEFYSKTAGDFILNGILEGIQGPQGPQGGEGKQGKQGPQGFGIRLKATLPSETELAEKVATARIGDAYWTSDTGMLYVFTDDPDLVAAPTFLKSPPLKGKDGPQGVPGPKGDPGPGVAVTSPANHGVTSDLATNVSLIKQGRLANLIMTVWTKGTAKTSGSYNQLGTLPVGYRGLGFQTVTVPGSSKTVTIDVYENGGVWVVWNTARAAGDTTTTRVAITYFTES